MDDIRFRTAQSPTTQTRANSGSYSRVRPVTSPGRSTMESSNDNTSKVDEPLIPLERLTRNKPNKKKRKRTRKGRINRWLMVVLIFVLICLAGYLIYGYLHGKNSGIEAANDPNNNSEELALAIKDEVSKYLEVLPAETPKLETISDPSSMGVGFKDTQPGDKVLYFESAGKAVIYRPSTGKVVVYTYFTDSSTQQETSDNNGSAASPDGNNASGEILQTPTENGGGSPLLP